MFLYYYSWLTVECCGSSLRFDCLWGFMCSESQVLRIPGWRPYQRRMFDHISSDVARDALGCAKTGSGKSYPAWYGCLLKWLKAGSDVSKRIPVAVVIAPATSLCYDQSANFFKKQTALLSSANPQARDIGKLLVSLNLSDPQRKDSVSTILDTVGNEVAVSTHNYFFALLYK